MSKEFQVLHPVPIMRAAKPDDVAEIITLFADEVHAGRMLPRIAEEMRANIDMWRVAEHQEQIVGCVSLVFFNPELCEVRSLSVSPAYRGNGLGAKLIEAGIDLAREKHAHRVLTLTRATQLFEQLGFQRQQVLNFPEKVWHDCTPCPLLHNCDEVALVYHIYRNED